MKRRFWWGLNKMIINYFSASYCAPCKTFWPIVNKVAEDLDLWIVKQEVDAEDYEDKFGIRGVPCVVVTGDNGENIPMGYHDFGWRLVE